MEDPSKVGRGNFEELLPLNKEKQRELKEFTNQLLRLKAKFAKRFRERQQEAQARIDAIPVDTALTPAQAFLLESAEKDRDAYGSMIEELQHEAAVLRGKDPNPARAGWVGALRQQRDLQQTAQRMKHDQALANQLRSLRAELHSKPTYQGQVEVSTSAPSVDFEDTLQRLLQEQTISLLKD